MGGQEKRGWLWHGLRELHPGERQPHTQAAPVPPRWCLSPRFGAHPVTRQGERPQALAGPPLGGMFSSQRKPTALVQSKWDVENSLWFSVIHTSLDLSWELAPGGLVTKSFPLHATHSDPKSALHRADTEKSRVLRNAAAGVRNAKGGPGRVLPAIIYK